MTMRKIGVVFSSLCFMAAAVWKFQTAGHDSGTASPHLRHLLEETGNPYEYRLFNSAEISYVMQQWTTKYPKFARVTTSQERYGLPRAGDWGDCPHDEGAAGCLNYILTIQDYSVHPVGSESSRRLPTVLWSGELHGDERVGPTATIEAASLLLRAATCEAKPDITLRNTPQWESELQEAEACRADLDSFGITTLYRQWLARLVATRRIIVVPTANALGFDRGVRWEGPEGVDPNRDFPIDNLDPSTCMRTIAGRTLNEIFREYIVTMSLTFHGGIEMIAYEWGATSFTGYRSPDDEAQRQLASSFSAFGGGWSESQPYIYGPANDIIYSVRGGMEDWAYAGSFLDPEFVQPCTPTSFGGYPRERTIYDDSTLRAFNMLIETSDEKLPNEDRLGLSTSVVDKNAPVENNGHVSRNIRVALLAADQVEPYVSIVGVNGRALSDDVVPEQERNSRGACQGAKKITVPIGAQDVVVQWTVGGAMTIDDTSLLYGRWQDVSDDVASCMSQPSSTVSLFTGEMLTSSSGTGYYSSAGAAPSGQAALGETLGPVFEARINLSQYTSGDEIVVMARARVDSSWLTQPSTFQPIAPSVPPQSHMANVRTNPAWSHQNMNNHIVQGRLDWYATIPLTIVFGTPEDGVMEDESNRFRTPPNPQEPACLKARMACSAGSDCCSGICLPGGDGFTCMRSEEVTTLDSRLRGGNGRGGGATGNGRGGAGAGGGGR